MAAYFVAIIVISAILAVIPIKIVFIVHIARQFKFAIGTSVSENLALRNAHRRLKHSKPRKRKKLPFRKNPSAIFPTSAKILRHLLRRGHLKKLRIFGSISTQDAAHTALLCGCARALEGALIPLIGHDQIQIALDADFSSGASDIHLIGMVSLRAGHIISAALIGAWNYISAIRRRPHGKASH